MIIYFLYEVYQEEEDIRNVFLNCISTAVNKF